jgi:hypothetical protein
MSATKLSPGESRMAHSIHPGRPPGRPPSCRAPAPAEAGVCAANDSARGRMRTYWLPCSQNSFAAVAKPYDPELARFYPRPLRACTGGRYSYFATGALLIR